MLCSLPFSFKLAFSSFKMRNRFSVKDPVPFHLRSRVVYQFTCKGCNACYVGEIFRHISTRIREHLGRDRTSHIFHHLQNSDECRRLSSQSCFSILATATNRFQLKLKEAAHIRWTNPSLNRQLKHAELTLSFYLRFGFSTFSVFLFFAVFSIVVAFYYTFLSLSPLGCVFLCSTVCARFIHFSPVVTFPGGNLNTNGNVVT